MDFENLLNFERASVATYYDADGVLQTAAIDEPRLDHDPVTLEPLGLLVEEERTNLITNSNVFAASTGTDIDPSSYISPSGELDATLVIASATSGEHYANDKSYSVAEGVRYTFGYFVKRAAGTIDPYVRLAASIKAGVSFDLGTQVGTVRSGENLDDYGITQLKDGWFFVWISGTAATSGTAVIRCQMYSGSSIFLGDGTSGLYHYGRQFEEGGYPTSYIPTTGAPVTRSPDVCSVKSVDPWIDQNEGTLYVQLNKKAGSYTGNYLTLSDGTASNQVVIKDRSVFYKETNYMPSPFDPSGWVPDADGTITNITLENASGSPGFGLAEVVVDSSFFLINRTFNTLVSEGEKVYCAVLVEGISPLSAIRCQIQNQSGSQVYNSYVNSTTGNTFDNGDGPNKVDVLPSGEILMQFEYTVEAGVTDVDCNIIFWNLDQTGGASGLSTPKLGDQQYVQAAFFGKANDWPAIISDTNVIQAGANNLTGAQSFAASLESGESKLALSYDGSTYSASKDGVAFSGVNAGVPALTDLYIGSGEDGTSRYFNGHIIDAQYFPRKLDESELVDLTT